ncbi:MAG: deoxynucleoside kinase [Fusobacteriaceae bacterium]|nr:deoxynucleoside kinase [Fusobacteriaceae bacterium]
MYYKNFFDKFIETHKETSNILCIDGVVGVGKSTLGELIAKEFGIEMFKEPIMDNPLLDKFYYDKKRYSFPLQIFFLNKRFQMIREASELKNCLMDRSIYGDIIFSKMLCLDNEMSDDEYKVYEELLETLLKLVKRPKLMIYLKSSVDNAIKKIKERGRSYELDVPYSYWESLNKHYQSYFQDYNLSEILVFDMDVLNPRDNIKDREFIFDEIRKRLEY